MAIIKVADFIFSNTSPILVASKECNPAEGLSHFGEDYDSENIEKCNRCRNMFDPVYDICECWRNLNR